MMRKPTLRVASLGVGLWALGTVTSPVTAQTVEPRGSDTAYMGVYLQDLSKGTRAALGLEEDAGVLLEGVQKDGPAAQAGLQAGDVILEIGGKPIGDSSGLSRVLRRLEPGEDVEVIVWRARKRHTFQLELAKRRSFTYAFAEVQAPEVRVPAIARAPRASYLGLWSGGTERLGIQTQDLTGQLADFFQVERGALVIWVTRGSPAADAGVKAGDVVVAVAGEPIQGESDLETVLAEPADGDEGLLVVVVRRGEKKEIQVPLD
jgi:serine protease Do